MPRASCLRLLTHWARRAASRADWTAGNSSAIKTAMIAMTTSNSMSVKPARARRGGRSMGRLLRVDASDQSRESGEVQEPHLGFFHPTGSDLFPGPSMVGDG